MVARGPRSCLLLTIFSLLFLSGLVAGYEVSFTDKDYERQFCSGMWGGKSTYINGELFKHPYSKYTVSRIFSHL